MTECYCEPETGVTCLSCQYRAEIERLRARLALAERVVEANRALYEQSPEGRAVLAAYDAGSEK